METVFQIIKTVMFYPKRYKCRRNGYAARFRYGWCSGSFRRRKNTSLGALVNFKGQTIANSGSLNNATALLPSIYFKFNSATLSASSYESLTAVARYLKENPKITLVIRGYSDPMGSESYNKALV